MISWKLMCTKFMQKYVNLVILLPSIRPLFLSDATGWIEIDQGTGDKYHHAQGNYLPGPLMTMGGAYRYKLVNSKPVECTPEEIAEQEEANQPELPPDPGDYEARIQALEEELAAAKIILGVE